MIQLSKKYKDVTRAPDILKSWLIDASKSININKQTFSCRYLDGNNECSVYDNRPEICEHSLSPLMMESMTTPFVAMGSGCGWLDGAPPIIKEIAKLQEEITSIDTKTSKKEFKRWQILSKKFNKLIKSTESQGWSVIDGSWSCDSKEV